MLLCCAEWRLGRQDECGGRGVQEGEGVDGAAGGDGGVLKGMDAFNTKNDFLQLPKNAFHSGVKISKASLMRIYSRVYISKNTITHLVRLRIDIRSEHNHQTTKQQHDREKRRPFLFSYGAKRLGETKAINPTSNKGERDSSSEERDTCYLLFPSGSYNERESD